MNSFPSGAYLEVLNTCVPLSFRRKVGVPLWTPTSAQVTRNISILLSVNAPVDGLQRCRRAGEHPHVGLRKGAVIPCSDRRGLIRRAGRGVVISLITRLRLSTIPGETAPCYLTLSGAGRCARSPRGGLGEANTGNAPTRMKINGFLTDPRTRKGQTREYWTRGDHTFKPAPHSHRHHKHSVEME